MESKLISQKDLDLLYKDQLKVLGKERVEAAEHKKSNKELQGSNKSIFLCHSHLDKTLVKRIFSFFNRVEIDVYVDWMDTGMPESTDRNTAAIIKGKIDNSHKFLFLATYNALRSKWCNWELGLAYSSKGERDFAILPIESRSGKWKGSEYLQLYPEMRIDLNGDLKSVSTSDIKINFYNTKSITLKEWFDSK